MSRLTPIDPANAQGKEKDLLNAVQQAMGATPNIFTNYFNEAFQTTNDFPAVSTASTRKAA